MDHADKLDLFPAGKLQVTLLRLCHQLVEHYGDFSDTVILGAQPRGVYLAKRIQAELNRLIGRELPCGELDATFYRDDFRMRQEPLAANRTHIDFLVENQHVIFVDDVLYTGRTIRAGMDAMMAFGRPKSVALLVLVDRKRKRELPIEPSYVGIEVDTIETQYVAVQLRESGGEDKVFLVQKEE
ncbi:MAG: bifunctional pyr operon transcriptional regulator/uracil phosphoribosyltransferase PyrR [Bacteroidota bacterium]